jgi:F-type H+-transporting ATPase subunit delta
MSARTSATRYAKALLDVSVADSDAERVERDLAAFVAAVDAHRDLRQVLTAPSVPASGKRGVVTAVATRLGFGPTTMKTLQLLAERDRLALAGALLAVFRERLLERRKIVRADVRSAVPLSPEALASITARLGVITGKNVAVDALVDTSLLGGVVAKVGSTVYDGSVKTQLDKLRKQLAGAGG